jgi:hypothetical protein
MAKMDERYRLSFGTRLRLFLRVLAITGVVCCAVGALLLAPIWKTVSVELALSSLEGNEGKTAQIASCLIAGGLGVIALSLFVEFLSLLRSSAGSRSLLGFNSTLQTLLAAGILVAINVYSFQHYARVDLTLDQKFTLPKTLVEELRKLQGETEIVVFLRQPKTGTALTTEKDEFEAEAEKKIVEKVLDLVDLFREIGPSFRVTVLDGAKVQRFKQQVKELTENKPQLREAIEAAPNNSIFFFANGKVQRLGFEEFYQLNKTESQAKQNLVLQPRGLETFTRRVLFVEEKRPRIGLCVVHDLLTSKSSDFDAYTHSGLRKSLESNGFEVVDVILKKWDREIEPAAYSPDEYRVEETREDLDTVRSSQRELEEEKKDLQDTIELFTKPTKEFYELFRRRFRRDLTETERLRQIESMQEDLKRYDDRREELRKEEQKLLASLEKLEADDRLSESRKVTDVKSKFQRIVDSCDLLIVPRSTWMSIPEGMFIPPRLQAMTDSTQVDAEPVNSKQVEVIKQYLKRGKPVLACLGPNFENPFDRSGRQPPQGYARLSGLLTRPLDGFERILMECGVEFGPQIVLYDEEQKSFTAARTRESFAGGTPVKLPPVQFAPDSNASTKPNPIAKALTLTSQSIAQPLDIRIRHPRPVYLVPGLETKIPYSAEFLFTSSESWNESLPFGTLRQIDARSADLEPPRFNATRNSDPKKGTREEERRGPFPIGVALQTKVPLEWYDEKYQTNFGTLRGLATIPTLTGFKDLSTVALTTLSMQEPQQVRLAVIGHGGLFSGKDLSPATQKLLTYTCNWLLSREEKLPNADSESWSYPRVELKESEKFYWHWGTFIGLPLLFAYFGILVLLMRRGR